MRLDEALAEIVTTLNDADIRAVADIRDLNTPGAYVALDRLEFDGLGTYTMRAFIYAVAPNSGRIQALKLLGPLVEQIRTVWPVSAADFVDIATPDSGDPLPAFRMPTAVAVTYE